jgi:hypothetical protein
MMGVMLETHSNFNVIKENNMIKNKVANAFLLESCLNRWKNNYWDDWIGLRYTRLFFLPKVIFGYPFIKVPMYFPLNFDWRPATEPFDI